MTAEREIPRWALRGAAIWSSALAAVGGWWAVGGAGYPLGPNDPRGLEVGSLFAAITPLTGSVAFAALGLAGLAAGIAVRTRQSSVPLRGFGGALAVILLFVVPDIRVVQNFAYLFFGYTGLWDGALAFQVFCMLGGALWACVAVDGRVVERDHGLARWGKGAAYVAAMLMLPYPVVRIAWALGVPLGIPDALLDRSDLTARIGEAGLGAMFVVGAGLTIGLARRWGETLPGWMPFLGGRDIPVWLAVVPAAIAAILISQAGLRIVAWTLIGQGQLTAETWGMGGPGLSWLPAGAALGVAAYGYYLRRLSEP